MGMAIFFKIFTCTRNREAKNENAQNFMPTSDGQNQRETFQILRLRCMYTIIFVPGMTF